MKATPLAFIISTSNLLTFWDMQQLGSCSQTADFAITNDLVSVVGANWGAAAAFFK